jgi:hypothetical protein
VWIREKLLWKEKFLLSLSHRPSFLSEESLPHTIIVVSLGTLDLSTNIVKLRGRKFGRLLELPCVTNVELAVMFGLGVLHLKRSLVQASWTSSQKSCSKASTAAKVSSSKKDLGPQKALCGKIKDCKKELVYEGKPFVNSLMQDLVRFLEMQLNKGG